MSQAATVLAHAGSNGGEGGGSALTFGIVAVLVLGWASLGALGWVFYAAKKRDDRRAKQQLVNAPAPAAPPWSTLDTGTPPGRPGSSGPGAVPPAANGDAAHGGREEAAPTPTRTPGQHP